MCAHRSVRGLRGRSPRSPGCGTHRQKRGKTVSSGSHQLGSLPPPVRPCLCSKCSPERDCLGCARVSGPHRTWGGKFPQEPGAFSRRMGSDCWGVGVGSDKHPGTFSVCRQPPRRLLPQPGSRVPSSTCPPDRLVSHRARFWDRGSEWPTRVRCSPRSNEPWPTRGRSHTQGFRGLPSGKGSWLDPPNITNHTIREASTCPPSRWQRGDATSRGFCQMQGEASGNQRAPPGSSSETIRASGWGGGAALLEAQGQEPITSLSAGSCPPLGLSSGHQRDACWFLSRAQPLLIPGGAGAREQDMGSPGQIQGVAPRRAPDVGGWSPIHQLPLSQRRGPRKAGPHAPCWAQPRREAQTTAINGSGVTPPAPHLLIGHDMKSIRPLEVSHIQNPIMPRSTNFRCRPRQLLSPAGPQFPCLYSAGL